MKTITTFCVISQFLTLAFGTDYKTVELCMSKTPNNIRNPWKPNSDEMRDVMLRAAIFNEQQIANEGYFRGANSPNASERSHVGTKTPVLGSTEMITDTRHDAGFFSTVFEAYSNHYNLRTRPEDWWYTIIQTVALAIDKNSKRERKVRKFFVQHKGKKNLNVQVKPSQLKDINTIDYSWLFDQFSEGIEKNINVPEYVQQIIPDFTTTTIIHKIVSQITLMTSVQEFFSYGLVAGCGIPAIEMKGTLEDWINLGLKIKALRKTLKPIGEELQLECDSSSRWCNNWWDGVENIAEQLLKTFNGDADEDFWSQIIFETKYGSGGETRLNGWFTSRLLKRLVKNIGEAPSGLVSVPVTLGEIENLPKEQSAVIAGMMGYKFHHETNITRPSVEGMHGWALLLEPNSPRRKYLTDWEQRVNGVLDNSYEY